MYLCSEMENFNVLQMINEIYTSNIHRVLLLPREPWHNTGVTAVFCSLPLSPCSVTITLQEIRIRIPSPRGQATEIGFPPIFFPTFSFPLPPFPPSRLWQTESGLRVTWTHRASWEIGAFNLPAPPETQNPKPPFYMHTQHPLPTT